ncbi:transglutaminaseTgpA domain-containing protein [Microbacterium paludicola]|uniref:transglutaminase family protein n=1 Tax=Microbacterium paludicola TaxID=300019 RepID=UPI003879B3B9
MPVAEAPPATRESLQRLRPAGRPDERRTPPRGVRGDLELTLGVAAATIAAMLPIGRLVEAGWMPGAVATILVVLFAGYLLRRMGVPGIVAAVGELLVWAVCATLALGHDDALLGFLPTLDLLRDLPRVLDLVGVEVVEGVAPIDPSREFAFVLIAAGGFLAFCIGHVVRDVRLPLLAAVVLITVFAIPQLAVPGDPDFVAAVFLIAAILWLVRAEIRARRPGMEAGPVASTWAGILGVGSVVAALILSPMVPLAPPTGGGVGRTSTISATLDLGDDLRRPADVEVLRLRTDAPSPPYLRVATLTRFDGITWAPDEGTPLSDLAFPPLARGGEVTERTTSVEITRLTGSYLPVPYPATAVEGVQGQWTADGLNRTVRSASASALGQRYVVTSQEPQITREEARAVMPRRDGPIDAMFAIPPGDDPEFHPGSTVLPEGGVDEAIRAAALEAIGDASTAYDALIAMQSWFRLDGGFSYSLDAPVEEGFDGSGMDAIERFLDVRSGYCVHFASTFAVMARSLGIPSRVVVGFLPGDATGEEVDDQDVYSVLGSQLHAWPEAYLDGIGWVPFEPTVGLGSPTSLRSATAPGTTPSDAPAPSSAPTPAPSSSRDVDRGDAAGGAPTGAAFNPADLLRWLAIAVGAIILLALPAAVRAVRWTVRLAAARRGDAGAAWRELQDLVIDAGYSVDESESPRAFAAHLTRENGVAPDILDPLVRAIERASFAPPDGSAGPDLARSLTRVRHALLPAGRERLRASLLPRSLAVRPRVTSR